MKEIELAVVWSNVKSITNREDGAQMEIPRKTEEKTCTLKETGYLQETGPL